MGSFDVITVGSATLDLFLRSSHFEKVRNTTAPDGFDACFPLGSKIGVDDLVTATGGGATNAAATFAGLKLKTACVTRIGRDAAGDEVLAELKRRKIARKFVRRDAKARTSTSVILLAGTGHRAILAYHGASDALSADDVPTKAHAQWWYFTSFGGNTTLLRHAFHVATTQTAHIAWNPGERELMRGLRGLKKELRDTDVLIINREEAALLSGLPSQDTKGLLEKLSPLPRMGVAITDGGHGAYLHMGGHTYFAPALSAKRVNTTGAGDAFGSGLVSGLLHRLSPEDALRLAMLNATSVVSHMGAKAGVLQQMPTPKALKRVRIVSL